MADLIDAGAGQLRLPDLLDQLHDSADGRLLVGRDRRPEAVLVALPEWERITGEPQNSAPLPPAPLGHLGHRSDEDITAYEVARETFNVVIGWCQSRRYREEKKPDPDTEMITFLVSQITRCIREQRELDPTDREGVARAIQEYGSLSRALLGNPR
jgi:hypothetical protein